MFFGNLFNKSGKDGVNKEKKSKSVRARKLNFESLEARELLSVTVAEFDAIRAQYADLELSSNMSDYNLIEITTAELSEAAIRAAMARAGETAASDLIVVRTDENSVVDLGDRTLRIDIDSAIYGDVFIVSAGQDSLYLQSGSTDGVLQIVDGNVGLGGVILVGVENEIRETASVFDLLTVNTTGSVQTSRVVQITENDNPAGNFSIFGDQGTSTTLTVPPLSTSGASGSQAIGSKSYSVIVSVGGALEAYLTGISYSDLSLIVAGNTSFLSALTPFDAEKTKVGDTDLCWAGTSSNMLAYTGWGDINDFETEDDIFEYFIEHFTDNGGRSYYGNDWFISGNYRPEVDGYSESQWAMFKDDENSGGNLYPDVEFTEYAGEANMESAYEITNAVNRLKDGAAIGLSLGWYDEFHEREGGHAITMWGAVYDTALSPLDNAYYVSLLVTDSDDNIINGGNRADSANVLKALGLAYSDIYSSYRLDDYSVGTGYLEGFTWLNARDAEPEEPKPDLMPNRFFADGTEPLVVYSALKGSNDGSDQWIDVAINTTDTVYVAFSFINRGTAAVPAGEPIRCKLTLTGSGSSTPIEEKVLPYSFGGDGLGAGYYYRSFDTDLASALAEGTYTITLEIDTGNTIAELDESNNVYEKTFTIGSTTVTAPTGFTADTDTAGEISLSWTGSASGYVLEYKRADETSWTDYGPATSPATVSGLDPGTVYEFRVKGVDGNFYSDWAYLSALSYSPAAPTGLSATCTTGGQVVLEWAGAAANSYTVYQQVGSSWVMVQS